MKFRALCGFTRAARFPVVLAAIAISSLVAVLPARAEILHESATFVAAGSVSSSTGVPSGVFINNPFVTQFLGSRFSVDEEVEVDMIGGHIYGAPLSPTAGSGENTCWLSADSLRFLKTTSQDKVFPRVQV